MSPPKPASPRMLSVIGVGSMESDGPSSRPTTTVATSPAPGAAGSPGRKVFYGYVNRQRSFAHSHPAESFSLHELGGSMWKAEEQRLGEITSKMERGVLNQEPPDLPSCWNKFKACDFPPPLMDFSPAIPFKIEFSPHQPSTAKPPHLTLRLVLGIRTAAVTGTVVALLYDCPIYSSPSLRTILRGGILHHPSRARDRVSRTASHYIASSASACVSQSLIRSFARKERHSATGQANIRTAGTDSAILVLSQGFRALALELLSQDHTARGGLMRSSTMRRNGPASLADGASREKQTRRPIMTTCPPGTSTKARRTMTCCLFCEELARRIPTPHCETLDGEKADLSPPFPPLRIRPFQPVKHCERVLPNLPQRSLEPLIRKDPEGLLAFAESRDEMGEDVPVLGTWRPSVTAFGDVYREALRLTLVPLQVPPRNDKHQVKQAAGC
ncbi:uncharacterized protein CLUP02_10614 [Colletotrichum lupini]|uniref:Uncharacterized protein n=1 Tax=Colletotrichum lupini TaxID=145971 RepID=A0A9Q8WIQ5_9PEZI|nr:uncharacterized protein CLUP02_10614 [Colletotrichum lupini]UQC85118.1 hypothetical protein CLUP02_10614 [Colletotrichum lupini]